MKRVFSLLFLFIMCSVFCFTSLGSNLVSAAEKVEVGSSNVVYKIDMLKSGYDKSLIGTLQVQQYYKKSGTSGVDNTSDYNAGKMYKNENKKTIYEQPLLDNSLAVLYITNNGDVIMGSANGVEIVNVRFYYLIAKSKDENAYGAFCPTGGNNYILCENARSVKVGSSGTTLWKSEGKSGVLSYSKSTLENVFTKKPELIEKVVNGKKVMEESGVYAYTGMNLFDTISTAYKDVVKDSGMYIMATMSVKYEDNEYIINSYAVDNSNFKFSEDSKATSNAYNSLSLPFDSISENKYTTTSHTTNELQYLAALIKPENISNDRQSNALGTIEDFWNKTLRPIMIFAIGILFVIVGTSTGVTIVKSSDEPEVRRDAIKKLIGLFIGAFIIEVLLIFFQDIVEIVRSFL